MGWSYITHIPCFWCERLEERNAFVLFQHPPDPGVGLGLGWGHVNVHLKLHTHVMLRWVWSGVGVGVGVMSTFICSCTPTWCYAGYGVGLGLGWGSCQRSSEVAHPRDATLGMGWGWGWVVVKHSRAEFTRKRGRARTAGTQQLDRQWHHVKKSVPNHWTTTSKGKIRERALWKYFWRGQWHHLNEGHVFASLGKLCKHHRDER